jgi:hypothetical protein
MAFSSAARVTGGRGGLLERVDVRADGVARRGDLRHPERDALPADHVRLLRRSQLRERIGRFARLQIEGSQPRPHRVDVFFRAEQENCRGD